MELELFTLQFLYAILSIILIDLVLGGDNAIIIGMAARNLPRELQKRAILWGALGAVIIRILATVMVVWLLEIPGIQLAGGLLLVWMAYKLLVEEDKEHKTKECNGFWAAIRTIIIADAAMGVDNILAVAGAAHSNFIVVIIGLMISIPIVVWGSTMVINLIERFPTIIYLGAAVIAFTAGRMILEEPWVYQYLAEYPTLEWSLIAAIIAGVLVFGRRRQQKGEPVPVRISEQRERLDVNSEKKA